MSGRLTALLASAVVSVLSHVASGQVPAMPTAQPQGALRSAPNRPPLVASPFIKLPLGAIEPRGWLRAQLELEAEGFSGHLSEISRFCRFDGNAWASPQGQGHSHWEELPYWLKGFGDLGYVLNDARIIAEARKWIEPVLASQEPDGYFGPRENKATNLGGTAGSVRKGKPDLWPHMVMLNVLQSYYEYSGDARVLPFMSRFFRWEMTVPDEDFLLPPWQDMRAGDNLESAYWLYNRTGEAFLLELAHKLHRRTVDWTAGLDIARTRPTLHGVNICQGFREPAIYGMQTKEPRHLDAAERNYRTIMEVFGQGPGGMFGADENARRGYTDPRQAAESCSMAEFMHSFQLLTLFTGNPVWADRCEEVALNSFPACMTADLKALRYLTAPNMVLSDRRSKAPGLQNGGNMLGFDPHDHRCCQHNIAHGWPYYAENLWYATPGDAGRPHGGLAAILYAPCQVKARVADGTEITLTVNTDYPFGETVEITVQTPKLVRFPLTLRVPGWCDRPRVDGADVAAADLKPGRFIVLERDWANGDRVRLELPMKIAVTKWPKSQDCVSVSRGPLSYSLKIGEKLGRAGGTDAWPAWEMHPTTPWNYGLVLEETDPAAGLAFARKAGPMARQPFEAQAAPVEIKTKARRIPQWQLDERGLVTTLQPSPAFSEEPVEEVTLIPMGCARLRIAAFPVASDQPQANRWALPPKLPLASHCWEGDTTAALNDGKLPKASNDGDLPRFTWWSHKGTTEWVAYEWEKPRQVSSAEVYWFDDTGKGGCRAPASWRLLYKDGNELKPVPLTAGATYGTELDRFNAVSFEPVSTTLLRLEVRLKEGFSGGILEWRVK